MEFRKKIAPLAIIFMFMLYSLSAQVTVLDDSIHSGRNYEKAAFRLWFRQDIDYLKGVVVLVPGSNSDGRNWVMDSAWQDLAVENDLALMGCYFTDLPHNNMAIEAYANVKEGSGQALLDVLAQFGQSTCHPELSVAPLFLWGISAGGEFNYEFVCWEPERVAAFVVNKGGVYYTALCSEDTRKVPGLFFTGENDLEFRSSIIEGIFTINRRFGALWAFVEEPCTGHEIGRSATVSILFFNRIIRMRIPERASGDYQPVKLLCLKEEDGYVGDLKTKEYWPYKEWKRSDYPTAWLPDKEVAEAWFALIKGVCND